MVYLVCSKRAALCTITQISDARSQTKTPRAASRVSVLTVLVVPTGNDRGMPPEIKFYEYEFYIHHPTYSAISRTCGKFPKSLLGFPFMGLLVLRCFQARVKRHDHASRSRRALLARTQN